jgi:hypothetical protein
VADAAIETRLEPPIQQFERVAGSGPHALPSSRPFRGCCYRIAWTRSAPIGVLLSAALFGAGHIYEGAMATVVIGVYGLMFGILAEARQNLRPGIIIHAWHDKVWSFVFCRSEARKRFLRKQRSFRRKRRRRQRAEKK